MFSASAIRRTRIRLVVATEGGGDVTLHDGGAWSGYVGMRLRDVFEIGGGARLLRFDDPDADPADPGPHDSGTEWVGFGRLMLHADVDANRRVALLFGADVGAGHPAIYARLIWGLRVRVWRDLSLGLYPFTPTYTYVKDIGGHDAQRGYTGFTFPTTVELSFTH
jgi:hypothetical protein